MRIAIGNDHGGFCLKNAVIEAIDELGYDYNDYGCYDDTSVDYPDYAEKVANAIVANDCNKGILICGTGIGISIAANKVKGIRAALCTDEFMAEMTAMHNDSNVLCLGGRVTDAAMAKKIVTKWLTTPFEGGRHTTRIAKITTIENKN